MNSILLNSIGLCINDTDCSFHEGKGVSAFLFELFIFFFLVEFVWAHLIFIVFIFVSIFNTTIVLYDNNTKKKRESNAACKELRTVYVCAGCGSFFFSNLLFVVVFCSTFFFFYSKYCVSVAIRHGVVETLLPCACIGYWYWYDGRAFGFRAKAIAMAANANETDIQNKKKITNSQQWCVSVRVTAQLYW